MDRELANHEKQLLSLQFPELRIRCIFITHIKEKKRVLKEFRTIDF